MRCHAEATRGTLWLIHCVVGDATSVAPMVIPPPSIITSAGSGGPSSDTMRSKCSDWPYDADLFPRKPHGAAQYHTASRLRSLAEMQPPGLPPPTGKGPRPSPAMVQASVPVLKLDTWATTASLMESNAQPLRIVTHWIEGGRMRNMPPGGCEAS